jgi:hypothetical protein
MGVVGTVAADFSTLLGRFKIAPRYLIVIAGLTRQSTHALRTTRAVRTFETEDHRLQLSNDSAW